MTNPFVDGTVSSTFQKRACYKYIRKSDKLPRYDEIPYDRPFDKIRCVIRIFNPNGIGTWVIAAYDPDTMTAWGVAQLHEREVGSFSMIEMLDFRGPLGLPLERDTHWHGISLREAMECDRL